MAKAELSLPGGEGRQAPFGMSHVIRCRFVYNYTCTSMGSRCARLDGCDAGGDASWCPPRWARVHRPQSSKAKPPPPPPPPHLPPWMSAQPSLPRALPPLSRHSQPLYSCSLQTLQWAVHSSPYCCRNRKRSARLSSPSEGCWCGYFFTLKLEIGASLFSKFTEIESGSFHYTTLLNSLRKTEKIVLGDNFEEQ